MDSILTSRTGEFFSGACKNNQFGAIGARQPPARERIRPEAGLRRSSRSCGRGLLMIAPARSSVNPMLRHVGRKHRIVSA